jgi:hypothetical protein
MPTVRNGKLLYPPKHPTPDELNPFRRSKPRRRGIVLAGEAGEKLLDSLSVEEIP